MLTLLFDRFTIALIVTVIIASLLPCRGGSPRRRTTSSRSLPILPGIGSSTARTVCGERLRPRWSLGAGDVFVMKMHFPHLGDYEMNNHVVEYEQDRRIGWEPEAGRGHPNAAPDSPDSARWGQRWSYQLSPDGPGATVVTEIYDCSRAPEEERVGMDNGKVWVSAMAETLDRLDSLCTQLRTKPTSA